MLFFYDPNPQGLQVWYSLKNGKVGAHLQDGDCEYVGWSSTYKKALGRLSRKVPKRYEGTINYMKIVLNDPYR